MYVGDIGTPANIPHLFMFIIISWDHETSSPAHHWPPSKECLGQQARSAWWIAAPHSGRERGREGGEGDVSRIMTGVGTDDTEFQA